MAAKPGGPSSSSNALATMNDRPAADAWQEFAVQQAPVLDQLAKSTASRPPPALSVLRSSQLDAARLDNELSELLKEQLARLFTYAAPGRAADLEPELNLLLGAAVFLLSVWRGRAPPGCELLNLRYRNEHAMAGASSRSSSLLSSKPAPSLAPAPSLSPSPSARTAPQHHAGMQLPGGRLHLRSGVEGPGLTTQQRLAWGLGAVVVPYLWQRLARSVMAAMDDYEYGNNHGGNHGGRYNDQEWYSDDDDHRDSHPGTSTTAASSPAAVAQTATTTAAPTSLAAKVSSLIADVRSRRGVVVVALLRALRGAMRAVEGVWAVAALANSVAFLRHGTYRSLLERLIGARLVWRQAVMTRVISFEYLNRQLVWQEFGELLLCVLPLLNSLQLRATLQRCLPRPATTATTTSADNTVTNATTTARSAAGDTSSSTSPPPLPQHPCSTCPVCGTGEMTTPYCAVPCGHVYCYYCLRANCQADPGFRCPLDGERVKALRRWSVRLKKRS